MHQRADIAEQRRPQTKPRPSAATGRHTHARHGHARGPTIDSSARAASARTARKRREMATDTGAYMLAWVVALASIDVDWPTRLISIAAATALTTTIASAAGAHHLFAGPMRIIALRRIIRACALTALVLVVLDSELGNHIGRTRCVLGSALSAVLAVSARAVADRRLTTGGRPPAKVVLIADEDEGMFDLLDEYGSSDFEVVACVGRCEPSARVRGIPWRRSCKNFLEIVDEHRATGVLLSPRSLADEKIHEVIPILRRSGITVHVFSGLRGVDHRQLRTVGIGHDPFLFLEEPRFERCQQLAKRCVDVVLGSILLAIAIPIIVVAAAAIRLEDGGPILFKQRRVGMNGVHFRLCKLRTMQADAESRLLELRHLNEREGGPLFKLSSDPRVTRVGRILRATSIDELPQLWCVLRGDMSLVGPRPALPDEASTFDHRLAGRHKVRPGVTGLWQVEGRDSPSFDQYRRLDIFYVENWSIALDLAILVRTVPAVLGRSVGVVRRTSSLAPPERAAS